MNKYGKDRITTPDRIMQLIQPGMSIFIGTGVACAVMIDLVRLGVYGQSMFGSSAAALDREVIGPLVAATLAAFAGAFVGLRWLGRTTLGGVRRLVAVTLFLLGLALAAGVV